jgi:3'-phosphoadenosine 5'-phosphosulfate sulfotransferase (PAPS reductase)/FAD synthetase
MKVISLGWGVQSFTLAAMSALGDLPPVDVAIHADTGHESSLTYAFAEKYTSWLQAHGVRVATVYGGREIGAKDGNSKDVGVMIPAFTATGATREYVENELLELLGEVQYQYYPATHKGGMLRRQCTNEWKIAPIRRYLQAHRNGAPVEMWLGISLDEVQRMKEADVQYISNIYPLIDKRMTRAQCVAWLTAHNLDVPPKSACVFCPYHSAKEWRKVASVPEDWQHAVAIDEQIRTMRPPFALYVHKSFTPLVEVDMRSDEEKGQLSMWDDECEGVCGV